MSKQFLIFSIILSIFILSGTSSAQDPTPTPTPEAVQPADKQNVEPEDLKGVPAIAPNYASEDRTLPDLGRVGVDMTSQKPLTLAEAITLALENNKDIEVTRKNVQIAEFDLKAARGFYEPKFSGQTYFERSTTPNISFFTPDTDRITSESFVGSAGVQAPIPGFGTNLDLSLNNQRVGTDNLVSIISPQYNSDLTLSLKQPLLRGRSSIVFNTGL